MSKRTILLVEDDAAVRDIIMSALEKEYLIMEASCHADAAKFIDHPVELAIIDYMLPDADGFEVLKALRINNPELPAIIITGHSDENVVIRAIRSTVADYIKKPLSLAYLRRRISAILGGEEDARSIDDTLKKDEFIMDGISTYIQENYAKDLSLGKVSRLAAMSKFRFCRTFRKRFGQSFVSYVNKIRVNSAAELLVSPELRIIDIAFAVGYGSFSQFERIFKRVTGLSPREFRNKLKTEKTWSS